MSRGSSSFARRHSLLLSNSLSPLPGGTHASVHSWALASSPTKPRPSLRPHGPDRGPFAPQHLCFRRGWKSASSTTCHGLSRLSLGGILFPCAPPDPHTRDLTAVLHCTLSAWEAGAQSSPSPSPPHGAGRALLMAELLSLSLPLPLSLPLLASSK